jgi:hypothetical protein
MEPRNRCQGINSASLCSLAGRYDNPIPTRCLAPIDFLKIPALLVVPHARLHRLAESIPGQHTRLLIRAQKPALERKIDFASLCSLAGGTTNRVVVPARQAGNQFLGSLKGLQTWALLDWYLKTTFWFFSSSKICFISPLHVQYTHTHLLSNLSLKS